MLVEGRKLMRVMNMARMNNGRLLKEQRRHEIINLIHQQGSVSCNQLARQFAVSLEREVIR